MEMIGHEAVGGAEESLAGRGVQHDFAEARVERIVEPAGAAQGNGESLMHDGIALIILARKTREIKAAVDALAVERMGLLRIFVRFHRRSEPAHAGCYVPKKPS
jgi:hypothetical protein